MSEIDATVLVLMSVIIMVFTVIGVVSGLIVLNEMSNTLRGIKINGNPPYKPKKKCKSCKQDIKD